MSDRLTELDIQKAKNSIRKRRSQYVGKKPLMTRSEVDERKYAGTGKRKKDNSRKRKILQSKLNERKLELNRRNMLIRAKKNTQETKPLPGNAIKMPSASMQVDTTTSAYGDAGRGRPVPKFKEGGYCKGGGAAIKGTNFKGVF
tara:strand:+ start:461 stop:892 length:432 start_codon:yes stop_codon:yes gene_type:complete